MYRIASVLSLIATLSMIGCYSPGPPETTGGDEPSASMTPLDPGAPEGPPLETQGLTQCYTRQIGDVYDHWSAACGSCKTNGRSGYSWSVRIRTCDGCTCVVKQDWNSGACSPC